MQLPVGTCVDAEICWALLRAAELPERIHVIRTLQPWRLRVSAERTALRWSARSIYVLKSEWKVVPLTGAAQQAGSRTRRLAYKGHGRSELVHGSFDVTGFTSKFNKIPPIPPALKHL